MKFQKGFTLIEIVMVLVLLGILSAVAVPKYFDLQEGARARAAQAAIAELQARVNAEFAAELLSGNSCTGAVAGTYKTTATTLTNLVGASGVDVGNGWVVVSTGTKSQGETITVTSVKYGSGTDDVVTSALLAKYNINTTFKLPACETPAAAGS